MESIICAVTQCKKRKLQGSLPAAGEPSSLDVPMPREFLGNGRTPKHSQQRPAWCQVSSVSQQLFSNQYEFANWMGNFCWHEWRNGQAFCDMLFALSFNFPTSCPSFFLFLIYFLVEYNCFKMLLVSAVQRESALSIHMSLSSWTSLPPVQVITRHWPEWAPGTM